MNTPLVTGLIIGIVVLLLTLSSLLVRGLAGRTHISVPARLFWIVLLFDVLWTISFYIYGAELDRLEKNTGINDELFVAMATLQMWVYYISAILLIALTIWYTIHRSLRRKHKLHHS